MRLADYLKAHSLTEAQFAELIGVNRSTVGRWADAERPIMPQREHLTRIVDATNGAVTANDFMAPFGDQAA